MGGGVTASFCYDLNGNLTADGTNVYLYDAENRLVERHVQTNAVCTALSYTGTLLATLRYDPAGRLYQVSPGSGATRFLNDGDALVAEYSDTGAMLRRYVHGADAKSDDPIAWYEGAGYDAASERFLRSDWQGSIVAVADSPATTLIAINRYDEYGIPQGTNQGRFQYTGQAWIGELSMYYYKARMYSPTLGRFLQTDPIGYKDQVNLYAYVGDEPVDRVDPTGLLQQEPGGCVGSLTCGPGTWTASPIASSVGGAPSANSSSNANAAENAAKGALEDVKEISQEIASNEYDKRKLQLLNNIAVGKVAEDIARDYFAKSGYRIVGEQVYVRVGSGKLRIIDFIVSAGSYGLIGFEVKANGATRSVGQRRLDNEISINGGRVVSLFQ